MTDTYVITIGRQLGSGGREIGLKLSERLGISFFDKELIRLASQKSGLKEEFFEMADEKKHFSLFGALFGLRGYNTDEAFHNYYLTNETLFKIQSDVIRSLAAEKSSIFVGRCADYVLKEHQRCLTIFISGDMNDRIKRVAGIQGLTEEKARRCIQRADKSRADYYNYFTSKVWGSAESYHFCINSSVLGIDETIDLICRLVEKKFNPE